MILSSVGPAEHEEVVFCWDRSSGLRAIIAIHDTSLGPALGGCRMWPYDTEEEALEDALRLSEGMTYKSAAAGCNYGGGKAVIWGDPETDKSEHLFRALGRFVESLRGRFITGTDVGTTPEDFVIAAQETSYLVALPEEYGGSGDTSIITAFGVWRGMKACAKETWGEDSLEGRTVAVQGLGKVGAKLVRHLVEEGARVIGSDVNEENVRRVAEQYGIEVVSPEEIYDVEADVFSPNALGGVINPSTLGRLKCKIIAGAANNQLSDDSLADELRARGILYAPDYVINAGGLIQAADELDGYVKERAFKKAAGIYQRLARVFQLAEENDVSTVVAANLMAKERIEKARELKRTYLPR